MSDWESLEGDAKASRMKAGPACSVLSMYEAVREEHGQKAVDSILRAMGNHRLTSSSIHRALEKRVDGDSLPSAWSLRNHRAGRCTCKENS